MQLTGMKHGRRILEMVEFPVAATLDEEASHDEISKLIKDHGGKCVVKPVFQGGVGKKGKAGLVRIVSSVFEAVEAKKDLFFAKLQSPGGTVQANGVTFEGFVPSEAEIYVSITSSTILRQPVMTIIVEGGVDVEDVPEEKKRVISFNPITGIKTFHITNALNELNCPPEYISPLVQQLPKLWQAYDSFGLLTLELNPIRMQNRGGRFTPVACDIKVGFDQDNPGWKRLQYPEEIFSADITQFEAEVNMLRTYQGQSDVTELNTEGTILPFIFGGGANSAATEVLGDKAIISSDFGGNPPYEKMKAISDICFNHWLAKANVLLVIGGKANNTDIFVTFKAIFDSLKEKIKINPDIQVVIGRGGPNLIKGMVYARDVMDNLRVPYRIFGFDSSMVGVLQYTLQLDDWIIENKSKISRKAAS
ncbi:MAG: carboxylate--amine ligase [Spirochaetia bacterium]|nr:carboxylate--amine ligase [Spirochaetia bacterium]